MRRALARLNELKPAASRLKNDENGAALIEYTVLLGILVVAVIGIIAAVGTWVSTQWIDAEQPVFKRGRFAARQKPFTGAPSRKFDRS